MFVRWRAAMGSKWEGGGEEGGTEAESGVCEGEI